MIDDDDYGAVGWMTIGRGNRSTWRKPATIPFCPPQIPHELTWDRTRAAAVGTRRLTTLAMARPSSPGKGKIFCSLRRPDRLWGPPRGKGVGALSCPLTCNYCLGQEYVDLYIHSPIRLHGVLKHRDNFTLPYDYFPKSWRFIGYKPKTVWVTDYLTALFYYIRGRLTLIMKGKKESIVKVAAVILKRRNTTTKTLIQNSLQFGRSLSLPVWSWFAWKKWRKIKINCSQDSLQFGRSLSLPVWSFVTSVVVASDLEEKHPKSAGYRI
jgi:hypothetical protein